MGAEETLLLWLTLAVLEGDAPAGSEAVGEGEIVELALRVEEGEGAGVLLLLPVGVPDAVAEGEGGGVALPERDTLGVLEGLAPLVSEADWEDDTVELALSVLLGVDAGVEELEPVGEPVAV